jgi:hypothetical protein
MHACIYVCDIIDTTLCWYLKVVKKEQVQNHIHLHSWAYTCIHGHIHVFRSSTDSRRGINNPCIHTCIYIYILNIYICTHTYYIRYEHIQTQTHTHVFMLAPCSGRSLLVMERNTHMRRNTHTHTYIHTYIHTYTQRNTHVKSNTQTHTHIHTYTQTCMHEHTYIHTLSHTLSHMYSPTSRFQAVNSSC